MLARLARTSYRRRKLVVASWFALVVLMIALSGALAGPWASDGRLPGTDSQRARDLAQREFPELTGDPGVVVFADVRGDRAAVDTYLARVAQDGGVADVQPLHVSTGG